MDDHIVEGGLTMDDVEGKEVWLNAVGKEGKDVIVEGDFSIHIEYENYYLCYPYAFNNEPIFVIKQPSLDIEEYNEKGLEEVFFPGMGLYSGRSGLFQFIKNGYTKVKKDTSEIDLSISRYLKNLSKNSGDIATMLWTSAASQYDNLNHLLDFDEKIEIITDEPNLKVGYFTTNRFGKTNYNLVIITCKQIYYAKNCKFWNDIVDDEVAENEAFLDRLLKSVRVVDFDNNKKEESDKLSIKDKNASEKNLSNKASLIVEKNKQIKEIEKEIFGLKERIKLDEAVIRECEKKISEEKSIYENIDKQFRSELTEYDLKTNRIIEDKKTKEIALHTLIKEEHIKRIKADNSILLKEKKYEEADLLFRNIEIIKEKVNQLSIDIDRNNQIIIDRQKKYDQDKERRSKLIESIELKMRSLSSSVKDNNYKLKKLEKRKMILCNQVMELQKNGG